MLSYAKKLDKGNSILQHLSEASHGVSQTLDYDEPLEIGWASPERKRLKPTHKDYRTRHFDIGEQTRHKVDPATVPASMRKARKTYCARLFQTSVFLTPNKLKVYFPA